ncbi:ArsR family transcriptional regulator [Novosphingobium nitrogenifigens DSM 19370]|uniref:ArsR family transcriptional regulator n=1 Tax=Novosphingobium nitrogenifigens DSM 19370 TaxID=983920 RepID=F1Z606_9SPHN|nr:ArsR family transcriptional regulator [Novosphingobium nitrogenifigens DSM 19370]
MAQTAQGASLISQQLAMLRRAGLVRSRREAKQVFYTLVADKMLEVAQALAQLAGSKTVSLVPGQPAEGAGSSAPVAPVSQSAGQITAAMFAQVQPRG